MTTLPAFQHELDTSGLICPDPVMMLHAQIRRMAAGDVLRMVATDPATRRDIPKFCTHLRHSLLLEQCDGDTFVYLIRKRDAE